MPVTDKPVLSYREAVGRPPHLAGLWPPTRSVQPFRLLHREDGCARPVCIVDLGFGRTVMPRMVVYILQCGRLPEGHDLRFN